MRNKITRNNMFSGNITRGDGSDLNGLFHLGEISLLNKVYICVQMIISLALLPKTIMS